MRGWFVLMACSLTIVASQGSTKLPVFTVNLDDPPKTRWASVVKAKGGDIKLACEAIDALFSRPALINKTIAVLDAVKPNIPQTYTEEMMGIADALSLPYESVLMANLYNELNRAVGADLDEDAQRQLAHPKDCTSIVARNPDGKTVLHSRNQDYPLFFAPLTIQVNFTQNNQLKYTATIFAGAVGISGSAVLPNGWSFSVNARFDKILSDPFSLTIAAAKAGGLQAILPPRIAFDSLADTYDEAFDYLSNTTILSRIYYIIGGTSGTEGAVITRNRMDTANHLVLGTAQKGGSDWFVLQTNDDNWEPPLDNRRAAGLASMLKLGQSRISAHSVYTDVLSVPPVFATDTLHTDQALPSTGWYYTVLRTHNSTSHGGL